MTEKELHIITLGDIFKNIETEEKAFKFLDYIKQLQQELTKLKKENEELRKQNIEYQDEIFARDNSYYDMQD